MPSELLRIDPSLPLAWEDVHTLRVGFDTAIARVEHPSTAAQRLIALLREGVPLAHLTEAAARAGVRSDERRAVLEQLAPVLRRQSSAPEAVAQKKQGLIAVLGSGQLAAALYAALRAAGFDASDDYRGAELAILVERYLAPTAPALPLADAGIAHIAVRATDQHLRIGPLIDPNESPCLDCVRLHDRDRDPALAVLAAQLVGHPPAAETTESCALAAALVVQFIHRLHRGNNALHETRLVLRVTDGLPELELARERVSAHPECGCRSLWLDQAA